MQDDIKLRVSVETQQSEQNVDNLNKKIDQTQDKVEDLNKEVGKTGTASIGAWGNAFERALDTVDKEAGALGGNLKEVTGSLKQAVPLIKNVNSTAIKGLTGVKAAIAATGIGALILAITTIISHWEGFTKAVGISEDKFKEFKQTVLDVLKNIVSGVVGVGNVIVQYLLTPIRTGIEAFKGLGNVIKDVFTGNWKAIKDDATNAIKGISSAIEKGFNIKESYQKGKEFGNKFIEGVVTTFTYKKPELDGKVGGALKGTGKKAGKEAGDQAGEEFVKTFAARVEADTKLVETLKKNYRNALEEVNKYISKYNADTRWEKEEERLAASFDDTYAKAKVKLKRSKEESLAEIDEWLHQLKNMALEAYALSQTAVTPELKIEAYAQLQKISQAYQELLENRQTLEWNFFNENTKLLNEFDERRLESTKKTLQEEVLLYADALQSIGSIYGTLAEMEEDRIRRQVEAGEITEEQAKKQFETVKAWQYAETWINTLAGMTAALMAPSMQGLGIPGWIAAATQAASLLATGIAQTIKIKNTQFGSGPSGGGGNAGMAGATPLQVMSDITPSPTMNIPVSSEDTRVYILESDIQKSNNRVKVREDNTTW